VTETRSRKTVILGLGNLLMGDEGVGVHVVRELKKLDLPPGIEPADGGTAAFDLLPILKQADKVIIVDAVRAGGKAGSIYRFRPDDIRSGSSVIVALSLHQLTLKEVLHVARLLDIKPDIVIIGIEPQRITLGMGLSAALQRALPQVVAAIQAELSAAQD